MAPVLKKAKLGMSPAGLLLTKSGKVQIPHKSLNGDDRYSIKNNVNQGPAPKDLNVYGLEVAKIGDLVGVSFNGMLSAGTVGMIVNVYDIANERGGNTASIRFLDGTYNLEHKESCYVLTPAQVQEVIDYYVVTEKRPHRIVVNILTQTVESLMKVKPVGKADWMTPLAGRDYIE